MNTLLESEKNQLDRQKNWKMNEGELINVMIVSILAPLMNKVKACCENPLKNTKLAKKL
jgi:hypothetical protein